VSPRSLLLFLGAEGYVKREDGWFVPYLAGMENWHFDQRPGESHAAYVRRSISGSGPVISRVAQDPRAPEIVLEFGVKSSEGSTFR
jgi:hypothetical protein